MAKPKPFLIWFQQRSGSSHLVSLLNSHPEVHCKGEMFGCFPVADADSVGLTKHPDCRQLGSKLYRRIINQFPGRIENPTDAACLEQMENFLCTPSSGNRGHVKGFKLKFPSQARLFPEIVKALLQRIETLPVIKLTRRNFLQRAISVLNLERVQAITKQSNSSVPVPLDPIRFDVSEVVRLVKYYQQIESEFVSWPESFEHCLAIEYEELIAQQDAIAANIQEFLKLSQVRPLTSNLKKISPVDLSGLVANLDEIKQAMREHEFPFEV